MLPATGRRRRSAPWTLPRRGEKPQPGGNAPGSGRFCQVLALARLASYERLTAGRRRRSDPWALPRRGEITLARGNAPGNRTITTTPPNFFPRVDPGRGRFWQTFARPRGDAGGIA